MPLFGVDAGKVLFISCARYIGVPIAGGGYDAEARVTAHTNVAFEWRAVGDNFDERHPALARCNDAARRGIPCPDSLFTSLRAGERAGGIDGKGRSWVKEVKAEEFGEMQGR